MSFGKDDEMQIMSCIALCAMESALLPNPLPPLTHCIIGMCLRARRPKLPLQGTRWKSIQLQFDEGKYTLRDTYITALVGEDEVLMNLQSRRDGRESALLCVNTRTLAQHVTELPDIVEAKSVEYLPVYRDATSSVEIGERTLAVVASWQHGGKLWIVDVVSGKMLWTFPDSARNVCDICLAPFPPTLVPLKLLDVGVEGFPPEAEIRHHICYAASTTPVRIELVTPFGTLSRVIPLSQQREQPYAIAYIPHRHWLICMTKAHDPITRVDLTPLLNGADIAETISPITFAVDSVSLECGKLVDSGFPLSGLTWISEDTLVATTYEAAQRPVIINLSNLTLRQAEFVAQAAGSCVTRDGFVAVAAERGGILLLWQ